MMKYITIFILFTFISCSKGTDYSLLIEGDWEITSKKENSNQTFDSAKSSSVFVFESTGFNEGELHLQKKNFLTNTTNNYYDQFTFTNEGKTFIQSNNSVSYIHDVILLNENYFEVSYTINGIFYEEVMERIQ